jgi:small subunit ribosomal protein S17
MSEGTVRSRRKVRTGRVVSDKMDKTVVVEVERLTEHPVFGRRIRKTTRFKAHDETNQAKVGDLVEIVEVRPLSRDKRWRVAQIVAANKG